jgi:ABC-type glycerol-3-phosphate transport system substrate-binding protein
MAVSKVSKQQQEAWKFIQYVSSQHERWLSDVNFIQPVVGWDKTAAAKRNVPFLDVWAQAYSQGKFDEVAPHYSEIQDAIKAAVEKTIFDKASPQDAMGQAAKDVDGILSSN